MNKLHALPQIEAKDGYWFILDARLKLLYCLSMLLLVLTNPEGYFSAIVLTWCWLVLLRAGICLKTAMGRLLAPLILAGAVILLKLFTHGTTPLFSIYSITAYSEGFSQGGLIALRVLSGVSLILFLTLTTSTPKLIRAARWFKLPPLLVELAGLTYSYIFLFHQAACRIYDAQKVRLGYVGVKRSLSSLASLIGLIFIQAYDQSQRTYEAMLVRGYCGQLTWPTEPGSRTKSVKDAAVLSLWAVGLYTLSIVLAGNYF